MIRDVPEPDISPAFTIDDIHKIREWHYEMLKDATTQERIDFYNSGAREFEALIERARQSRVSATARR